MKEEQTDIPNIKKVIPIDTYGLIFQFNNLEYRIFEPGKSGLYNKNAFLAYPNKLKSFTFKVDEIVWSNQVSFDKRFIYQNSHSISLDDLQRNYLTVSFKNQAPTTEHKTHHEYRFYLLPLNYDEPFVLEESIGGGHAEMGGSVRYSLKALLNSADWKDHLEKSGCAWAIDIIEQNTNDVEKTINAIVSEICKRSIF
ncbi:hypothetical protein H7F33_08890 [Pedobacter sp. PAMC26386]|nr:hypothetical protein H7F33_08890 [Pedobacter sp. PAMC26386]